MRRERALGAMSCRSAAAFVALLSAAALAGCADPGTASAMDLAPTAKSYAAQRVPGANWQGIAAVDGDLDFGALQEALAADSEEAQTFLDAFDLRVSNGAGGDGLAGSWFSFHYLEAPDGRPRAAATVQVFADGRTPRALVQDLDRGSVVEAGTPAPVDGASTALFIPAPLPLHRTAPPPIFPPLPVLPAALALQPTPFPSLPAAPTTPAARDEARCTGDHMWRIDSPRAVEIARTVAEFRDHERDHPSADYAYSYLPATVDDPCDGNVWYIEHLDFERLLSGKGIVGVAVVIDAADGTVLDVEILEDLVTRVLLDGAETDFAGPPIPTLGVLGPVTHTVSFTVPANATSLAAGGILAAGGVFDGTLRLRDPDGVDIAVWDAGVLDAAIDAPRGGAWTFAYSFDTVLPSETHTLRLFAAVRVSR